MPGRIAYCLCKLCTFIAGSGNAWFTGTKQKAIVPSAERFREICSLVSRQPVEDGDRRRDITFESPEHNGLCTHVTLCVENGERKPVCDCEAKYQYEKHARAEALWPHTKSCEAIYGGH